MSSIPSSPLSLPSPGKPAGTPDPLVRRWDSFIGSVAAGLPLPDAMLKHFVTRADIETMTRLPGEAGKTEAKRWAQARSAGKRMTYSLFDIEDIFERIASGMKVGEAVNAVKPGSCASSFLGVVNKDPDLIERYKEVKEVAVMMLMDQVTEIADDKEGDVLIQEKGPAPNMAAVQRSRLQMDARVLQARAHAPRYYSDKREQTITLNINAVERLERANARLRDRPGALTRAEKAQAIEAEVVAKTIDTDTSWMDDKPTETIWLEEK